MTWGSIIHMQKIIQVNTYKPITDLILMWKINTRFFTCFLKYKYPWIEKSDGYNEGKITNNPKGSIFKKTHFTMEGKDCTKIWYLLGGII